MVVRAFVFFLLTGFSSLSVAEVDRGVDAYEQGKIRLRCDTGCHWREMAMRSLKIISV